MTTQNPSKKKIAVLGSGMGALTTVFYLTSQPDWQKNYEITIYQMGWRLGGKCATGRNLDPDKYLRIEEHGIHGFLGCYYNSLRMMRECYEELNRPKDAVLATFEEAFPTRDTIMRYEFLDGETLKWPIALLPNEDVAYNLPLEDFGKKSTPMSWVVEGVKQLGLALGYNLFRSVYPIPTGKISDGHPVLAPGRPRPGLAEIYQILGTMIVVLKQAEANPETDFLAVTEQITAHADKLLALSPDLQVKDDRNRIRRLAMLCQYMSVLIRGTIKDQVISKGFEQLNNQDFTDWLKKHGASDALINSPLPLSTPNVTYQYERGDTSKPPRMAAGAYLQWSLRTFSYLGHTIYLFAAGTGDTAIAPLYQVLKKRGVKIELFHQVTDLKLDASGSQINEIWFNKQATPKDPKKGYDPLIDAKGLPSWPSKPLYDQLVEGEDIAATIGSSRADLESPWCKWKGTPTSIKQGVDYDDVLLGISVAALKDICSDLTRYSKQFDNALKYASTVPTQAMQIWLDPTPQEMGWENVLPRGEPLLSANYLAPPNGQADFSKYIQYETWPEGQAPQTCLYICGTLPNGYKPDNMDGATFMDRMADRANAQSIQYLQAGFGNIYAGATVAARGFGDPMSLNFNLLSIRGAQDTLKGVDRFEEQYWRANVGPSEHYITTMPGSTQHRLNPETDFSNLYVTGDWINTGLNVGSVEGAVMGGLLTCRAMCGKPELEDILGYHPEPTGTT